MFERLGISALQQHDPLPGPRLELLGRVELGGGCLVEAVEVTDRHGLGRGLLTDVEHVLDQHPERPCPSRRCGSRG